MAAICRACAILMWSLFRPCIQVSMRVVVIIRRVGTATIWVAALIAAILYLGWFVATYLGWHPHLPAFLLALLVLLHRHK